jgi:hypothetical protein
VGFAIPTPSSDAFGSPLTTHIFWGDIKTNFKDLFFRTLLEMTIELLVGFTCLLLSTCITSYLDFYIVKYCCTLSILPLPVDSHSSSSAVSYFWYKRKLICLCSSNIAVYKSLKNRQHIGQQAYYKNIFHFQFPFSFSH